MKNDKTLAFLALIFVVLFSYWTFQQIQYYLDQNNNKVFDQLPDTSSSSTESIDNKEFEDGSNKNPGKSISSSDNNISVWVANDYVKGDITEKPYTVKYGDTLWEIAEGVYGDGTQWVNILKANAKDIGFLPDGSQALIFPGQVLQIP